MRKGPIVVGVGVFCVAVIMTAFASDNGEKQVAMTDVPIAVRTAAEKAIAGGSLERVVMEKEDGRVAYSVQATMAGKSKELTFATDGTLLAEEDDVAFSELPEAVRAAAVKYFGSSRELRASIEIAKAVTTYEVNGRKAGKARSLTLSAQGALLEDEEEAD